MLSTLTIPDRFKQRVVSALEALPAVGRGKVVLTVEFNCGTGGSIGSMKLKRFTHTEDEVQP